MISPTFRKLNSLGNITIPTLILFSLITSSSSSSNSRIKSLMASKQQETWDLNNNSNSSWICLVWATCPLFQVLFKWQHININLRKTSIPTKFKTINIRLIKFLITSAIKGSSLNLTMMFQSANFQEWFKLNSKSIRATWATTKINIRRIH